MVLQSDESNLNKINWMVYHRRTPNVVICALHPLQMATVKSNVCMRQWYLSGKPSSRSLHTPSRLSSTHWSQLASSTIPKKLHLEAWNNSLKCLQIWFETFDLIKPFKSPPTLLDLHFNTWYILVSCRSDTRHKKDKRQTLVLKHLWFEGSTLVKKKKIIYI